MLYIERKIVISLFYGRQSFSKICLFSMAKQKGDLEHVATLYSISNTQEMLSLVSNYDFIFILSNLSIFHATFHHAKAICQGFSLNSLLLSWPKAAIGDENLLSAPKYRQELRVSGP